MTLHVDRCRLTRFVLAGLVFFGWSLSSAQAQFRLFHDWRRDCLEATAPSGDSPRSDSTPRTLTEADIMPGARTTAALGDQQSSFGPGYLDNAVPFTHFRLRVDAAYNNTRPDRAEYFYAKCGCFKVAGIDPNAPGPIREETSVDNQDISAYLEVAASDRLSGFVELPYRFLNPERNDNTHGLADMNAGFKYAILRDACRVLTFQGRVWFPTGAASHGLGTHHFSVEPSLIYTENVTDRLTVFGQFGGWIPIDGTDFAGDILRYGVGAGYTVSDTGRLRITPIAEMLGWTVLGGRQFSFAPPIVSDARGDTIINAKFGVRFGFGDRSPVGLISNSDLYVGYGHALTSDAWYTDILRIEYRVRF